MVEIATRGVLVLSPGGVGIAPAHPRTHRRACRLPLGALAVLVIFNLVLLIVVVLQFSFFFRVHVPWVYVSFGFFFSSQVIRDCVTQPVVAFPFVLRAAVPVLFCALFFF